MKKQSKKNAAVAVEVAPVILAAPPVEVIVSADIAPPVLSHADRFNAARRYNDSHAKTGEKVAFGDAVIMMLKTGEYAGRRMWSIASPNGFATVCHTEQLPNGKGWACDMESGESFTEPSRKKCLERALRVYLTA